MLVKCQIFYFHFHFSPVFFVHIWLCFSLTITSCSLFRSFTFFVFVVWPKTIFYRNFHILPLLIPYVSLPFLPYFPPFFLSLSFSSSLSLPFSLSFLSLPLYLSLLLSQSLSSSSLSFICSSYCSCFCSLSFSLFLFLSLLCLLELISSLRSLKRDSPPRNRPPSAEGGLGALQAAAYRHGRALGEGPEVQLSHAPRTRTSRVFKSRRLSDDRAASVVYSFALRMNCDGNERDVRADSDACFKSSLDCRFCSPGSVAARAVWVSLPSGLARRILSGTRQSWFPNI